MPMSKEVRFISLPCGPRVIREQEVGAVEHVVEVSDTAKNVRVNSIHIPYPRHLPRTEVTPKKAVVHASILSGFEALSMLSGTVLKVIPPEKQK